MFVDEIEAEAPFTAATHLTCDASGRDQLLTIIKVLYQVPRGGDLSALDGAEVRRMLVSHDPDTRSSIRYPSDLAPHKPGTEVLLVGHARKPDAFPDARFIDVTLSVAGRNAKLKKSLRVFGPRTWVHEQGSVVPSAPGPAEDLPLRWEHAFGGTCPTTGEQSDENPLGSGFAHDPGTRLGKPCHRIERLEADNSVAKLPAGFGAVHPTWEPRRSRRGSVGPEWATTRAPLPPHDQDPRYHSVAPDDQWLETPLLGDETFMVSGTKREGAWLLTLDGVVPELEHVIGERVVVTRPHLDTVILDADRETVELSFRVCFPAPRGPHGLSRIVVRAVQPSRASDERELPENSLSSQSG